MAGGTPSHVPEEDPKAPPSEEAIRPVRAMTLQDHAREIVFNYVVAQLEKTNSEIRFDPGDVLVTWFAYVLGNWKAMVTTNLPDGMYYEVTHNALRKATFLDAYKKCDDVSYPDTGLEFM